MFAKLNKTLNNSLIKSTKSQQILYFFICAVTAILVSLAVFIATYAILLPLSPIFIWI